MELKVKYQYTYFIKPFIINSKEYEKYLLTLLENKKCNLKIFEKERDLNLYSYFIQNVREYFFPTFSFDKVKVQNFNNMSNTIKAKVLSKFYCNIFDYTIDRQIQGKIEEGNGIFFNIDKIEIICFDTGICFFIIKTNVENTDKFSDVLNFNFKFKDINSDFTKLKEFSNIKIQTDKFNNMTELSDFIDKITGIDNNTQQIDLYNKRFFAYTYACIDQDNWNSEEDFKDLETDFLKFSNVLSGDSTLDFNPEELENTIQTIEQFRYAKFGFTKQSASLMASGIDINNYTKLLFDYENSYFYTLIISLYQRIYLKKLENDFKNKKDIGKLRECFSKFTKEILLKEITNSVTGTIFYKKWRKVFELEEIYDELKNKYDILYKEMNIDRDKKVNKVILIALVISVILNVVNFITLLNMLK